jgi:uncharacterized protein YbaR (Trm112 family)/SAM-dependent methyltransferase
MHPRLLEILACPVCGGAFELSVTEQTGETIDEGTLRCSGCARSYPITAGIPRLLPEDPRAGSQEHFVSEFTQLAEGDRDIDPPELLEYLFYSRAGIDPSVYEKVPGDPYRTSIAPGTYKADRSFLENKLILDAGCGPGRFTGVAAAAPGSRVVGMDVGEHIDRARSRLSHLDNVDLVQGSALAPPFVPGSFDYAFSIGVLHHTPDPRAAALAVARLVGANGAISLWVYPPSYWGGPIKAPVAKALHRRMSKMDTADALRFCTRRLYPLGKLQARVADKRWKKYLAAPLFLINVPRHPQREVMIATIYDYYGPTFISVHTDAEVVEWLRTAGFANARSLPVPTSVFATR